MSSDDHSTLPAPTGNPQQLPPQVPVPTPPAPSQVSQNAPQQQPQYPQYPQPVPMPQPQPHPSQLQPSQAAHPQPPQQPARPAYTPPTYIQNQPSYATPFPAAPQRPTHPYQPLTPNPAPNPYWANPELPQVPDRPPAQQSQPQPPRTPAQAQSSAHPVQAQSAKQQLPPIANPKAHSTRVKHHASKKTKIIIIAAVVTCALIAAALAYLYVTRIMADDKKPLPKLPVVAQPAEEKKPAPEEKPKTTILALDTLTSANFIAPTDIPASFKPFDYKTPGVTAYITEGKKCELQVGLVGPETLPGVDAIDIMNRQVAALRKDGSTISDPVKMVDLSLKNVDDPNISYTLSSFSFTATLKKGKQARSYYSVAILKDGKRAYILRTCNDAAPVPDTAMKEVEALAAGIKLKPVN